MHLVPVDRRIAKQHAKPALGGQRRVHGPNSSIEILVDGESGFFYRDPREDGGADFNQLLGSLVAGRMRPDPREATAHMAAFSYPAMVERTRSLLRYMKQRLDGQVKN